MLSGSGSGLGLFVLVLAVVASALWLVDSPQDAAAQTPNIVVSFTTDGAQSPELLREAVEEGDEGPGDRILGSSGEVLYHTPEGNKMMVEVSLSAAHGDPTEVQVAATGQTASAQIDYLETSITITIPAWHTYGRGYFTITDDDKREGNETFTLALNASVPDPGYPTASVTNHATLDIARVTIIDDDAPIVSVRGGVTIIEGETPTWIFHSSFPVGQDMTIGFVTDISGVTTSGMVTMPAGQTRIIYRGTPPTDDSDTADPPDITLNLQQRLINQGGGYRVGEPSSATIEVHDNDGTGGVGRWPPRRLTISAPFPYWSEGNPNAYRDVDRVTTFTVRAPHHLGSTVVFEICFTGTATQETGETWSANGDYQILKGGIVQTGSCIEDVISGHGPSANIAIRVRADNTGEEDETVIATVSTDHSGVRTAANNTKPGPYTFASYEQTTYTIIDDDSVDVWLRAGDIEVLEGDTAEVELCQSKRRSVTTIVKLYVVNYDAHAGSDYTSIGTATIRPGLLCVIVPFQTISDGLDEGREDFRVSINDSGHSQGVTKIPITPALVAAGMKTAALRVYINDPLTITITSNHHSPFFSSRRYQSTLFVGMAHEGQDTLLYFDANRAAPWDIPITYSLSGNPYDAGYQITPARGQHQVILKKGETAVRVRMEVANDNIRQDSSGDCCVRIDLLSQPRYKPATNKQTYWVKVVGDTDDNLAYQGPPTTAVSNVQVTAVNSASATVTWDAVPNASSYHVQYQGTATNPINNLHSGQQGYTGTSWTFTHNAAESMTITVTITPEYEDVYGVVQRLNNLAGTATLTVTISQGGGQSEPAQADAPSAQAEPTPTPAPQACNLPADAISVAEITGWRDALDPNKAAAGIKRWNRVLATLGEVTGETAMTVEQAQAVSNWLKNDRWDRTARTLEAMAQCDAEPAPSPAPTPAATPTPAPTPTPAATPEVSIAAGNGVTEGGNATFTITAHPAPVAPLSVNLTVAQSGDYGVTTGAQSVTIPTSGTYTLTVATGDDSADEADGSVSATLNTGTGYTVSATASAATVAVSDNDDPPPACTLPADAITVSEVTGWRDALDPTRAAAGIKRWNRVLATLGVDTGLTPMTAELARQVANWLGNTRWDRTARTLEAMAQCDR